MTDRVDPPLTPDVKKAHRLIVCCFLSVPSLLQQTQSILSSDRMTLMTPSTQSDLVALLEQGNQALDCLILQESPVLPNIISWLNEKSILLPIIILTATKPRPGSEADDTSIIYHSAEVHLSIDAMTQLETALETAIARFLSLSPLSQLPAPNAEPIAQKPAEATAPNALLLQQRRLSEKLKERLNYMGVFYKRNPKSFLRNLPQPQQAIVLSDLKSLYRTIVLGYFHNDPEINQKIDTYVDAAFFSDIPVSQAVEIHMEIMDDFAKQLKLEGRNEEIVLDYRLTLIDTLAHLCEMYRRSIPKDTPMP